MQLASMNEAGIEMNLVVVAETPIEKAALVVVRECYHAVMCSAGKCLFGKTNWA